MLVRLPVRTALLQNTGQPKARLWTVRLPVRTALLQNADSLPQWLKECDYQSERHCSKTSACPSRSESVCDYQSERHCSKTTAPRWSMWSSAITSQNGTAPKPFDTLRIAIRVRLPVRTALLQNALSSISRGIRVRLPVRTALLQNLQGW